MRGVIRLDDRGRDELVAALAEFRSVVQRIADEHPGARRVELLVGWCDAGRQLRTVAAGSRSDEANDPPA